MDRAAKRFGSAKMADGPGKNEAKAEAKAESTASGKGAPHAGPKAEPKTVEMKPNKTGATAESESPHASMHGKHAEELTAMHGRHMQEYKDMHGRHATELTQMHGRHATEVGTPAPSEGPSTPSASKLAGKGWKTKEKGKGGTEPKGDKA